MKNSIKVVLYTIFVTVTNIVYGQNKSINEDTPVYNEVHHYSAEVKLKNSDDTALFKGMIKGNEFQAYEVKEIFSSKFEKVSAALEQINQTNSSKKDGMIIIDEYGRKIYLAVIALKRAHSLIEGGEAIKGIYYPNIVCVYGMEYMEDPSNPGMMDAVLRKIKFK